MNEEMAWLLAGSVVHVAGSMAVARSLYGRMRSDEIDDLAGVYDAGARNPMMWEGSVYGHLSHPYPGPVAEWTAERRNWTAVRAVGLSVCWEGLFVFWITLWLVWITLEGGKTRLSQYEMKRLTMLNDKHIAAMKAELSVAHDEIKE